MDLVQQHAPKGAKRACTTMALRCPTFAPGSQVGPFGPVDLFAFSLYVAVGFFPVLEVRG